MPCNNHMQSLISFKWFLTCLFFFYTSLYFWFSKRFQSMSFQGQVRRSRREIKEELWREAHHCIVLSSHQSVLNHLWKIVIYQSLRNINHCRVKMQRRVTEEPLDTGLSFWATNHGVHGRHSSHEYNAFAASVLAANAVLVLFLQKKTTLNLK